MEILCKFSYPTFQSIFFRNATHIFKIVISSLPSWRKLFSHFTSCATTLVVVSDNSSIGVLVRTLDAEERIKSSIFRLHPFTFALFVPVDWIALLSPTIEKSILFWVCSPAPPPFPLSLSLHIVIYFYECKIGRCLFTRSPPTLPTTTTTTTTCSRRCFFHASFCNSGKLNNSCFFSTVSNSSTHSTFVRIVV